MVFKAGGTNAFGLRWAGTKSFELYFRVSQAEYEQILKLCPYEMTYYEQWKRAVIRYDEKIEINQLLSVFKAVYGFFVNK